MRSKKNLLLLLPLLGFFFFSCAEKETTTEPNLIKADDVAAATTSEIAWDYLNTDWCSIGYLECCGTSQSPVNIIRSQVQDEVRLPSLLVSYGVTALKVLNDGHTIKCSPPTTTPYKITLGGKTFKLLQFHFHWYSEHAIDGYLRYMEVHFVHQASDGTLAVIGVLINPGIANTELAKFWSILPTVKDQYVNISNIDLRKLVPTRFTSYRYSGSLTTPPCSEIVSWVVLTNEMTYSASQITTFMNLFSGDHFPYGNRRPVQPLNGRVVQTDIDL